MWVNHYPEFPYRFKDQNGFVSHDEMPQTIHVNPPVYPDDAKLNQIEGEVYVNILINSEGLPIDEKVIKTSNIIFNEASIETAKTSKFTSFKRKGTKQHCWVVVPFRLNLIDRKIKIGFTYSPINPTQH